MNGDARNHANPGDLVSSLVSDLRPVRPVRLAREIAIVFVLQIAVVLAAAWAIGAGVSDAHRLGDPAFVALLAALAAGAGASAAAMATLSIPGRSVPNGVRLVLVALPIVVAASLVVFSPWGGTWKGFAATVIEGFGCTRRTLLVAAPAWLAGLAWLRRLGPLDPLRVGLFAGCSALLTASLAVQMACASCDSWHMAIAHYAPILFAAWLAAVLSPLVLHERS